MSVTAQFGCQSTWWAEKDSFEYIKWLLSYLNFFIQAEALNNVFPLLAKCPNPLIQEYAQVTHHFHLIQQISFFDNSKHQNINGKIWEVPPSVQGSIQSPAEGPQMPTSIFYRQRKRVTPDALKILSPVTAKLSETPSLN